MLNVMNGDHRDSITKSLSDQGKAFSLGRGWMERRVAIVIGGQKTRWRCLKGSSICEGRGTIWIFFLILFACITVTEQGMHARELLRDLGLFDNNEEIGSKLMYNRLERPVVNESEALVVTFTVSLQQIIDLDEKNQILKTGAWLTMSWNDYGLQWNESDYGGIKAIRVPSDMIWKPDILMYNSADEDIDSTFAANVVVSSNGDCVWIPPGLFYSTCKIDIKWFPFDDQNCPMKFGSWTYDMSGIDLRLLNDSSDTGDLSNYIDNGEFRLLGFPAKRSVHLYDCCPNAYIDITFVVQMRRRTLYYGFNLIIPCVLISTMALLAFTLPPDAGEKISLGVTVLLSLTVFLLLVAEAMPPTSDDVPLIGLYFAMIMMMCSLSVVFTVVVLNFHHRSPGTHNMPEWIKVVICRWMAWCLRMRRPGEDITLQSLLADMHTRRHPSSAHGATPAFSCANFVTPLIGKFTSCQTKVVTGNLAAERMIEEQVTPTDSLETDAETEVEDGSETGREGGSDVLDRGVGAKLLGAVIATNHWQRPINCLTPRSCVMSTSSHSRLPMTIGTPNLTASRVAKNRGGTITLDSPHCSNSSFKYGIVSTSTPVVSTTTSPVTDYTCWKKSKSGASVTAPSKSGPEKNSNVLSSCSFPGSVKYPKDQSHLVSLLSVISGDSDDHFPCSHNIHRHDDHKNVTETTNSSSRHSHLASGEAAEEAKAASALVPADGELEDQAMKLELFGLLEKVLEELRSITKKNAREENDAKVCDDWKFTAMVVDRLCLCIFVIVTIGCTFGILFSATHISA